MIRPFLCWIGFHSGKCKDGIYQCSNCSHFSVYNRIQYFNARLKAIHENQANSMGEINILTEDESFEFFDNLRESGRANILLAPGEMVEYFECSKKEADKWFNLWCSSLKGENKNEL